ncbi:MAG TPA: hypothetical protein VFQ84_04515 [Arenimonas sp.]|uniref:hypothetical protein n=1 Tax=Arenimonas sp. TaxID=1872635 RepID=UPI002D800B6B|nr:hypothetical protein [Arenimonas sp.]HEU0152591.1 hypothetical protein [Arenimonas sp.]
MRYDVRLASPSPNLAAIRAALGDADPAAMTDFDRTTGLLRVSATLGVAELARLLASADQPVALAQIMPLPSTCCGGCGG